ncbi:putative carbonic anhydrase 5 [Pectinophora gossypiella]|uniref:putative carbonic anhydrase 5 n=1 Tax=Pectinophora gossypiella TaxID=13191 RepID=UPI00214EA6F0|nr:putative carbonic anhydrase 5 [Pectinophora gossypiella]
MYYICAVLTLLSLDIGATSYNYTKMWTYDDERTWPGRKCKEGGRRQSPIDIRTDDIIHDYNGVVIRYGTLTFTGYRGVLMTGINNGLTVQFSTDGDTAIHPILSGGPLQHRYRLEQLHFHWLSEHAVNGRKFPMEIHFVHVRTDLTVEQALKQKDGLAIIAMFGNVQAVLNEDQEDRISEIMEVIPRLLHTGDRISGVLLNLMKLMSPNTEQYYTYFGSLTSPECNEVVIWIIFENPITISDAQYRLFGKIGESRHNFRSLQPVMHHLVYKPRPASVWNTPYLVTAIHDFVDRVAQFFRNVTRFVKKEMIKP